MLHNFRGHPFIGVVCPMGAADMELRGGHFAWKCGAQVVIPLVLSLDSPHSGTIHGTCSVLRAVSSQKGRWAQDAILQTIVAPVFGVLGGGEGGLCLKPRKSQIRATDGAFELLVGQTKTSDRLTTEAVSCTFSFLKGSWAQCPQASWDLEDLFLPWNCIPLSRQERVRAVGKVLG